MIRVSQILGSVIASMIKLSALTTETGNVSTGAELARNETDRMLSSYVVLLVLLPLCFIGIEGQSETAARLRMLALSAPMVLVPSIAAMLTRWLSAGAISAMGLLIAASGLLLLAQAPPGSGISPIPSMVLIGIGSGFPGAGMASGVFGTTRVAGEGIGREQDCAAFEANKSSGVMAQQSTLFAEAPNVYLHGRAGG